MMQAKGRLIGLGVGPGDPELITLKALRLLRESPVVAYFVAKGKKGNAFGIIEDHLVPQQTLMPLVYRNQSLSVLSGVLPHDDLNRRLAEADAAVIMKLGRNFPKVRQVLEELGLAGRALYVERATMANQKIVPLDQVDPSSSPYFSLIIVPGERWQG